MSKRFRENYFIIVRLILNLMLCLYGFLDTNSKAGVSFKVLLLVAVYISLLSLKEHFDDDKRVYFIVGAALMYIGLLKADALGFIFLGYIIYYEFLLSVNARAGWYPLLYIALFIESPMSYFENVLVITILLLFYMQHEFIVEYYKKQTLEDTINEQRLKRDMLDKEYETKEMLKKNRIMSENKILEERAALSQTLHDKLGHNINGSIYQLEASKVVMDKDPDKARSMIQAVIDQLRTGMDEIRAILRKERPEKRQMSLIQLNELCEDCNEKGVITELVTEGDLSVIPNDIWEVVLDNAFEAVTNSMRYARCSHINISILVMNKMIRVTVTDDGIGCDSVTDGMGISGMRKRVRSVGGTIDFETEAGFKVSMLLPI